MLRGFTMKIIVWLSGALLSHIAGSTPTAERTVETTDKFTQCLEGWYQYGNKCYRSFGKSPKYWQNWASASEECFEYGGQLASIHSREENEFLATYVLLNAESTLWIGLNDRKVDRQYEWDDDSVVNFTMWDENEPTYEYNGHRENCGQMVFWMNSKKLGKWNDLTCHSKLPYLCQMPADANMSGHNPKYCSESIGGGYSLHNSCYHVVDSPMTWSDAEAYCQSTYSGHLAAVTDYSVQKFLSYILRESAVAPTFWIGLKAPADQSVPLWSSGWQLSFTRWANSDHQMSAGNCVTLLKGGHWEAKPCERTFSFICEVSNGTAPKLEPSVDGLDCPASPTGWRDLGGDYCYYFNTDARLSWHEANFQCQRRGGTLASIHSKAEQETLTQFIRYKARSASIGLFRKYDDCFAWVDGSQLNFQKWQSNEPNSHTELCVEVVADGRSLLWNDISCDSKQAYICSVRKMSRKNATSDDKDVCFH